MGLCMGIKDQNLVTSNVFECALKPTAKCSGAGLHKPVSLLEAHSTSTKCKYQHEWNVLWMTKTMAVMTIFTVMVEAVAFDIQSNSDKMNPQGKQEKVLLIWGTYYPRLINIHAGLINIHNLCCKYMYKTIITITVCNTTINTQSYTNHYNH